MARYDEATFRLAQELRRKSVARLREAGKEVPDREEANPHSFRPSDDSATREDESPKQTDGVDTTTQRVIAVAAYNAAMAAALHESDTSRTPRERSGSYTARERPSWADLRALPGSAFFVPGGGQETLDDQIEKLLRARRDRPPIYVPGISVMPPTQGDPVEQARARLAEGRADHSADDSASPRRASRPAGS